MPRAHDKIPRDHQLPVVLVQSADLSLPLIPLYPTTPLEQFDQLTRLALPLADPMHRMLPCELLHGLVPERRFPRDQCPEGGCERPSLRHIDPLQP